MVSGREGNHPKSYVWGLVLLAAGIGACANLIGADEWTLRDEAAASSGSGSGSTASAGGAGGAMSTSSSSTDVGGVGGAGGGGGVGGAGGVGGNDLQMCLDAVKNGAETGIDCGGGVCPECIICEGCKESSDCLSNCCAGGKCVNPIGGMCNMVTTCPNGCQDGTETDVDCGGGNGCPQPCGPAKMCIENTDCESNLVCNDMKTCVMP